MRSLPVHFSLALALLAGPLAGCASPPAVRHEELRLAAAKTGSCDRRESSATCTDYKESRTAGQCPGLWSALTCPEPTLGSCVFPLGNQVVHYWEGALFDLRSAHAACEKVGGEWRGAKPEPLDSHTPPGNYEPSPNNLGSPAHPFIRR
ncbi:MAG TPA: hypothetical protein VGK67_02440 [Myxococcales bacterium]